MHIYRKSRFSFIWFLLIAVIFFLLGWYLTLCGFLGKSPGLLSNNTPRVVTIEDREIDISKINMDLFWMVWEELENNYVEIDAIDYEQMRYGAIKGMVAALDDPYTVFMNPEESEQFYASLEGTLEGIGAELTVEEGQLIVVSPLRNSPAEGAGLQPGDVIYKIEDEYASEMTLFDAIMKIRGEKGTPVNLTIIREDLSDPFDVEIIRDSIDLESVTVEKIEGIEENIVYMSVNQFNDKTTEQFRTAVSEMLLNKPDGVIIDLRYNGGGYLDIAVDMLSFLLPVDIEAVKIKKRDIENEIMLTSGGPKILDVPVVVLVNEGSASASEIVAGAVQAHNRGVIMGTQTFGKGTVQEVEYFSDGSSMRITIAKWFLPDGRCINETGITPDTIVELEDVDLENNTDSQKNAAIEYLQGLDPQ
ncbi:PDZ domain-containing protein [Candidatus Peregrinibacteria bacterium]|nr:PDZ domain-containing protein [Candidatus Peregrinibacteria bacterium]